MTSTEPVRCRRAPGRPGSGGRSPPRCRASTTSAARRTSTTCCARGGDNVGLSTVYRTLQALADGGEVDMLRTEDGEAVYRRCSATHHHHLVCRVCGRTVEVEGPTVERWADGVAGEHGFTEVSHTLEIFGTCPDCSQRA